MPQLASVVGLVVLTLAAITGGVALAITGHAVPTELWDLAKVLTGAAAGAIIPLNRGAST